MESVSVADCLSLFPDAVDETIYKNMENREIILQLTRSAIVGMSFDLKCRKSLRKKPKQIIQIKLLSASSLFLTDLDPSFNFETMINRQFPFFLPVHAIRRLKIVIFMQWIGSQENLIINVYDLVCEKNRFNSSTTCLGFNFLRKTCCVNLSQAAQTACPIAENLMALRKHHPINTTFCRLLWTHCQIDSNFGVSDYACQWSELSARQFSVRWAGFVLEWRALWRYSIISLSQWDLQTFHRFPITPQKSFVSA